METIKFNSSENNLINIESEDNKKQSLDIIEMKKIPEYQDKILEYVKAKDITVDRIGFSTRVRNCLCRNGYFFISDIVLMDEEDLLNIPKLGENSANEVKEMVKKFLKDNEEKIVSYCYGSPIVIEDTGKDIEQLGVLEMANLPKYQDSILEFAKENDMCISKLNLSVRSKNCLLREGYGKISDFILESEETIKDINGMGKKSLDEIMTIIKRYLLSHEENIIAFCSGDVSSVYNIETIKHKVLDVFKKIAFSGLHYPEILESLNLSEEFDESLVKKAIGELIADKQLEYVDFRCYRKYISFEDFLVNHARILERNRTCTLRRLEGETLEIIGQDEGISRERVRQIINKTKSNIYRQYIEETGLEVFDEDYYKYFYTTYKLERNICSEWLGISSKIYNYLDFFNKKGQKDISEAMNDSNIDVSLKLRISNYLNKDKINIGGNWVKKTRTDLENVVLKICCKDEVPYEEFIEIYNNFLEKQGISFDPNIYFTKEVVETRYNRLSESRLVLWKQSQMLRYYDIDGQDYSELLDTLNLDGYENTEISTLKMFNDNRDVMLRYDIRDHYELHNLLRKIVPEGSYHDFKCTRMPIILFGEFDREAAILELLMNNAPITMMDLADIIYEEYGYDQITVVSTFLSPFRKYYHQGIYLMDQKAMPIEHRKKLEEALDADFYFVDEVKKIYRNLVPDADLETINSYNLKPMGFKIFSKYVLKNYTTLDSYFEHILTEKEIIDITAYRKRFACIQTWSSKLLELKKEYEIIEFEPNQIIKFSRLERNGITKEMLQKFCSDVYEYAENNTYFSMKSLRLSGFDSELYELGFSDWFYANILCSDERFTYNSIFKSLIFYKGEKPISINSFIYDYVSTVESIDVYDLMNVLENEFGCELSDRNVLMSRLYGINLYYDSVLQRLYLNEELYYKELDNDLEVI